MASSKGQPAPILVTARNNAKRAFDDVIKQAKAADNTIAGLGKRTPRTLIESFKVLSAGIIKAEVTTRQLAAALKNVEDAGKKIAKVGAVTAGITVASVKVAGDFSLKLAEIATLSDEGAAATRRLSSEVLDLSDAYGLNRGDVASAYYQGVSAGATDGAEAVGLLDTAAKLAIGGVTDLTTSVDTITSALNAYNRPMADAVEISDQLFTAVKFGKTNNARS